MAAGARGRGRAGPPRLSLRGSWRSATTPTRSRPRLARLQQAHLDVRRELGAPEPRTRAAGRGAGARGLPRAADREESAPVDGHGDPRADAARPPRRPGAGPGARCPARCPSPTPAAGRCRSCRPARPSPGTGRCRRRSRYGNPGLRRVRPATSKPIGCAFGPVERPRLDWWWAGTAATSISPTSVVSPAASSITRWKPARPSHAPAPRGTISRGSPPTERSEGRSRWSLCRWEMRTASIRSTTSRAGAVACRRRCSRPGSRNTGSVSSRTPPSSTSTVECPTNVRRCSEPLTVTASPRMGDAVSL